MFTAEIIMSKAYQPAKFFFFVFSFLISSYHSLGAMVGDKRYKIVERASGHPKYKRDQRKQKAISRKKEEEAKKKTEEAALRIAKESERRVKKEAKKSGLTGKKKEKFYKNA